MKKLVQWSLLFFLTFLLWYSTIFVLSGDAAGLTGVSALVCTIGLFIFAGNDN